MKLGIIVVLLGNIKNTLINNTRVEMWFWFEKSCYVDCYKCKVVQTFYAFVV